MLGRFAEQLAQTRDSLGDDVLDNALVLPDVAEQFLLGDNLALALGQPCQKLHLTRLQDALHTTSHDPISIWLYGPARQSK